ncbi:MAG: hypothetical protein AAGN35_21460 [Bacteroidota bacterium]
MRNRKLFHLLALLGEADRARFSQFLSAEYFNNSGQLVAFWEQWQRRVFPLAEGEKLSKAEFVAGTNLKISRFDNYCSQLYLKARQFLALEEFSQNAHLENVMLSEAIMKRDRSLEAAEKFVPPMIRDLEQEAASPEKYLGLLHQKAQWYLGKIRSRKKLKNWHEEFAEFKRLLNLYAVSKNLQLSCGEVNIAEILHPSPAEESHKHALDSVWKSAAEATDLLPRAYYLTLALLKGIEPAETFARLLDLLKRERAKLADDVAQDIFQYMLNYSIRQINKGDEVFLRNTHDLYLVLVENGDLLQDGKLSSPQFKNIIAVGCRLGRLDWAQSFIATYQSRLLDGHDGMAAQYNQAVLAFHLGEYGTAIRGFKKVINRVTYDVFYGVDARIYLWKAYFENWSQLQPDEIDDMFRLYDSFRLYIDRNKKISATHKIQYRNLVRLFKQFIELLQVPEKHTLAGELDAFKAELEAATDVANKVWFLKKVEEAQRRAAQT